MTIPATEPQRTAPRAAARRPKPALPSADRFVARWRPEIDRALALSLAPSNPAIAALYSAGRAAAGLEGVPGHRWRPLLTLATVAAFGSDPRRGLAAACAVELTHTASLVLDDLPCMDDSPLRRGQDSAHVRIGSAGAILVAVGLLGRAAELLGQDARAGTEGSRDWGAMLGLAGMAGGQAVDLTAHGPLTAGARRLHRRKTTALAGFALAIGARVAGAPEQARLALERVGHDLGWAYQLADDAADRHDDRVAGRPSYAQRAARAITRLAARAERTIADCPAMTVSGRKLLLGFEARLLGLLTASVRAC